MALLRRASGVQLRDLKGYEDLPRDLQVTFGAICADIDNGIAEFEKELKNNNP